MTNFPPRRMDVDHALESVRRRTLSPMKGPLDRMIYLASLRDYNTGLYYHAGLASQFTSEVACEALAACHHEAFQQLLGSSLPELVSQLEAYIRTAVCAPDTFVATWRALEPYRVAVPVKADPVAAELLFSNFQIALAVLEVRQKRSPARPQAASLHQ